MSEENKALIHRWFDEVWNSGRPEAIAQMLATDVIIHGLAEDGTSWQGLADFQNFYAKFREAFPNLVVTVEDTICEGEKVVARCSVRAKHTGESLGFAATHAPVEFTGIAICRVKDGKFVESWNSFDFMALYQQLGVI